MQKTAWEIWKGYILVADIEELENMDASDIYPRRIHAKGVFSVADGTAKLSGRDHEFREPTLRWEPTVWSEDFSRELYGEPGESQPTEPTDDAEARADFWSIQDDFIYHHEQ